MNLHLQLNSTKNSSFISDSAMPDKDNIMCRMNQMHEVLEENQLNQEDQKGQFVLMMIDIEKDLNEMINDHHQQIGELKLEVDRVEKTSKMVAQTKNFIETHFQSLLRKYEDLTWQHRNITRKYGDLLKKYEQILTPQTKKSSLPHFSQLGDEFEDLYSKSLLVKAIEQKLREKDQTLKKVIQQRNHFELRVIKLNKTVEIQNEKIRKLEDERLNREDYLEKKQLNQIKFNRNLKQKKIKGETSGIQKE